MDQKNDLTIKDNTIKDTKKVAIFENDSDFYVVHKKAERLSVATYMISNFFAPEEPMKWSLRRAANELIKDTVALSSSSLSVKDGLIRTLVATIVELISLYEVAHKAGFISEMNATVIKGELEKMLILLSTRESKQVNTKSISFDTSFFDVPEMPAEAQSETRTVESTGQKAPGWSQAHRTASTSYSEHVSMQHPTRTFQPAPVSSLHTNTHKLAPSVKDNQKDVKDKRQQIIISLIKKHRTLTIKGVTSVIKDCSEKTIQRELLALVAKGVLKKEGERRWSMYSLA